MQPGWDGGSCSPRPLIAWWLVQSYRKIEGQWLTDYPWVYVRICVKVAMILQGFGVASHKSLFSYNPLHFNGKNRHTVHTNTYLNVVLRLFSLSLVKPVALESWICLHDVYWTTCQLQLCHRTKKLGTQCVLEGRHRHLWVYLSHTLCICSPHAVLKGSFSTPTVRVYMCISANRLQRLKPSIWNPDIVELIGRMQSATDWEGMM